MLHSQITKQLVIRAPFRQKRPETALKAKKKKKSIPNVLRTRHGQKSAGRQKQPYKVFSVLGLLTQHTQQILANCL